MKIQIDTEKKEIVIDEIVNISELFYFLKGFIPENEWMEYSLIPQQIYNWANPIIIEKNDWYPYDRQYYLGQPYTVMSDDNTSHQISSNNTIYNVEFK